MKCEICNQGPPYGPTVYRVNTIGEMPAIWRCEVHLTADQISKVDPKVVEITKIIERGDK